MLLFLAVGNHRHAGRQFSFTLSQCVLGLQQLTEQIGNGAGQRSDTPIFGFVYAGR